MDNWLFFLVAIVAGMSMAIQGSLNSVLGKTIGELEATLVVHIIALMLLVILLVFNLGKGDLSNLSFAPWYSYLGGILNVVILYGVLFSISQLGVGNATTAIVAAQILTAVIIDHLGLWGLKQISFQWLHGLGVLFLALGVRLLLIQ
ncbi:DMT family transporter [Halanaerocella petrolearia]